jgi:uncharacterized membrane protein
MNAFTVLMAVMFGIYLMNFISSFLANLTAGWRTWARVLIDIFVGLVLLLLLLMSASSSTY